MKPYRHAFFKASRTTQPALCTGADIEHLADLPRTYWVMLSAPVTGTPLEMLLDTDGDGRIRPPEVLASIDWLKPRLASFDLLLEPYKGIAAADIRPDTPEGKVLLDLHRTVAPEGQVLDDAAMTQAIETFKARPANGDGVVPVDAIDAAHRAAAQAVAAIAGTETLSRATLAAFDAAVAAREAWEAAQPKVVAPAAVAAAEQLGAQLDAFFGIDVPEGAEAPALNASASEAVLNLRAGVSAYWAKDAEAIAAAIDKNTLTLADWLTLKAEAAAQTAWQAAEPTDCVRAQAAEAVAAAKSGAVREALEAAIAADESVAPLAAAIEELRKLAVLRAGFARFLRNFVNVADLYPPFASPRFLEGELYMDARCCALCFPLGSLAPAVHAALAKESRCCLAYCTLTRKGESDRSILAVFTAGTTGDLYVGKRGLYIDGKGRDWDATISLLDLSTVSLTEAFFTPWRKIVKACSDTVKKFVGARGEAAAAAASSVAVAKTQSATAGVAPAPSAAAPAAPASNASQMASVATLGISLSFIASAVATVAAAVTHVPLWKTGLVVLGIILAVSIPSVILAWIRLRNRDLAPILNASGWAVNLRIGLTARLGAFFTHRANYAFRRFVRRPRQTTKEI